MNYKINESGERVVIEIEGNLVTIDEFATLKDVLIKLYAKNPNAKVDLIFFDACSISSALLGYLLKLVQGEGKDICIYPKTNTLYNVFKKINLLTLLKVVEP